MGDEPCGISVVIPARNAPALVDRCLDALSRQTVPADRFEVLVVDDGSTDDTSEAARRRGARVIRQDASGAAAARNHGAREASGDLVLFLDADCEADEGWVEAMSEHLRNGKGVDAAVGRIDSEQTSLVARFVQLELEGRYARLRAQGRTDFVNSGNCGFRRSTLLENPFDESFHRLEDVELSFRLNRDGRRMVYVPGARARHRHPESVGELLRQKFHYARYVLPLYRRYPGKSMGDASTPPARRGRLLLLASAFVLALGSGVHPAFGLLAMAAGGGFLLLSSGVIARGFAASLPLGFCALGLVLLGGLAFIAGGASGLLLRRPPKAS